MKFYLNIEIKFESANNIDRNTRNASTFERNT